MRLRGSSNSWIQWNKRVTDEDSSVRVGRVGAMGLGPRLVDNTPGLFAGGARIRADEGPSLAVWCAQIPYLGRRIRGDRFAAAAEQCIGFAFAATSSSFRSAG